MKLNEEDISWLVKNFPKMKNKDLAKELGVTERCIRKRANKLGLKKAPWFMRQVLLETASKANEANHERNFEGINLFKKGVKPIDFLGEEGEKKRSDKIRESVNKLRREEKARTLYGLPRKTKLKIVKRPSKQIRLRYYLRKRCGYIMDDTGFIFYYDENTKRSEKIENRPRTGFKFLSISERNIE